MSAIEVTSLHKRFRGHVAVEDATFAVEPGRVCALLGPNGAGKTTTLRCLLGLARPDRGDVTLAGGVAGAVLDGMGFHPQRSGRDHLAMLADAAGVEERRVDEVLARVELGADARRPAGAYSLGMRGRLALAAALLPAPAVLVLDEPANGLDPDGIRWLRALLRGHADAGGTVLLSSHVLAEVELVADAAVVMAGGRTVAAGDLAELASGVVRVRTPERDRLLPALRASGADARATDEPDALEVTGHDTDFVGAVAVREAIPLRELVARGGLEELYVRATS